MELSHSVQLDRDPGHARARSQNPERGVGWATWPSGRHPPRESGQPKGNGSGNGHHHGPLDGRAHGHSNGNGSRPGRGLGHGGENGSLNHGGLEHKEHELRRLLDRLVDSQEQERKVVAKDIHDGLLQCIVAAEMRLECFESSLPGGLPQLDDLESGLDLLRSAIAEGRRIISDLRPSTLDDFGLVAALRCHLARLEKQTGWAFSFKEELGEQPLPPSVETAIFRIVQDALSPAQSDPQCRRVAVSLGRSNGHVRLRVRDWGQGLDPQATSSSGLELSTVQERASLLDGWCEIESEPGLGTTVEVGIPLAPQGSRADLESCLTALEPAAAGAL